MDLRAWLKPEKVAACPADEPLLEQLALEFLEVTASDPSSPRGYELAAACELAVAQYLALAGDWSVAETLKMVRNQDAMTKTRHQTAVAEARSAAKSALGRTVTDVVVRYRAIRNLDAGTAAKRAGKVVPFAKKAV
jgi:hypothetical protein